MNVPVSLIPFSCRSFDGLRQWQPMPSLPAMAIKQAKHVFPVDRLGTHKLALVSMIMLVLFQASQQPDQQWIVVDLMGNYHQQQAEAYQRNRCVTACKRQP